jgi:hypothetical protein
MQAPSENSFGGEPIEDPRRLAVQHFLKKLLGWHPVLRCAQFLKKTLEALGVLCIITNARPGTRNRAAQRFLNT